VPKSLRFSRKAENGGQKTEDERRWTRDEGRGTRDGGRKTEYDCKVIRSSGNQVAEHLIIRISGRLKTQKRG